MKIGMGVVSLHKENDLRNAFRERDTHRMFALLDRIGPDDQSDTLARLIIDKALTTHDAGLRNALAVVLADLGSQPGADAIRSLLRDERTREARGTLLYALAKMNASLDPETFLDTILHDSMEAAEYCVDALDAGRVIFPDDEAAAKAALLLKSESGKARENDRKDLLAEASGILAPSAD